MREVSAFQSLKAIQKTQWEQLNYARFPFASHDYLGALENSGSVGAEAGWSPLYLTAATGGSLEGACYLYSKVHSYGEYIFDWSWAQAYQRHDVPYFPKLVAAVPFTPATGPKLLFAKGVEQGAVAESLLSAARRFVEVNQHSSLHFLFITEEEIAFFKKAGFIVRHSFQYHWSNEGYANFADFLASLKSRKRKQIVKERAEVRTHGLNFRTITGSELTRAHAAIFYRFYLSTIEKMGAIAYLNEAFFAEVFQSMADRIVLFFVEEGVTPVAASLCYFHDDTLYGRYWGALGDFKHLHFELCYYQPMEWAMLRGLKRFEAGAQGEHKIARGFLPTLTYSAHWIAHPAFRDAIAQFVDEEKRSILSYFDQMRDHSPFGKVSLSF